MLIGMQFSVVGERCPVSTGPTSTAFVMARSLAGCTKRLLAVDVALDSACNIWINVTDPDTPSTLSDPFGWIPLHSVDGLADEQHIRRCDPVDQGEMLPVPTAQLDQLLKFALAKAREVEGVLAKAITRSDDSGEDIPETSMAGKAVRYTTAQQLDVGFAVADAHCMEIPENNQIPAPDPATIKGKAVMTLQLMQSCSAAF